MKNHKIGVNRFTDKLIANYLKLKKIKKFTSDAHAALDLLARFTLETPCGFSIQYKKHVNTESCDVTLNYRGNDYAANDGYMPMAICKMFLNTWSKGLRLYNPNFFLMKWDYAKQAHEDIEENGYDDVPDELHELDMFYQDFNHLFFNLNEKSN